MTIWVNGQERELSGGATVADAVEATGAARDGRGIAVALDGEVVPRDRWQQTALADGQHVEVVQAVQGG
jgi:sulfur carrier protein